MASEKACLLLLNLELPPQSVALPTSRSGRAWEPAPPIQRLCRWDYISTENLRESLAEAETEPFGLWQPKRTATVPPSQRLHLSMDFAFPCFYSSLDSC